MFENILHSFVIILALVVATGFINEKLIKLPNEIAYLIAGLLISLVLIFFFGNAGTQQIDNIMPHFILEDYLVQGVLCFMLFAGSCRLRFCDLKPGAKMISCLAILTTIVAAVIYGALCYLLSSLVGLDFSLPECLLLGAIISPTDPIAAMSILRKVGLPEDVGTTIEGESLFNDGVGIALFSVIYGMFETGDEITFISFGTVMLESIIGAVAVGFVISFLLFIFFKHSSSRSTRIFISLLAVAGSYVVCDELGFSAAIAAVVCGIYFATQVDKLEQKDPTPFIRYRDFWAVVDGLLNSLLYVMLGLTVINVFLYAPDNWIFPAIAVVCNIIARWTGVFTSALIIKERPSSYSLFRFTNLFTWAGLKGALSLALAMSTAPALDSEVFNAIIVATFSVVLFTTIGQGLTIGAFYKSSERRHGK